MFAVDGTVQHYAWGDAEAIPRLLGVEPDGTPQAEWWIGTHPNAPSIAVLVDGTRRPLDEVSGPLPFLVKVLAAAEPLSLQVHPDEATAIAGCAREDAAGIDRLAPERTYRDPFAKIELLCALTPFEALVGFRPVDQSVRFLRQLGSASAAGLADRLAADGLTPVVRHVLLDRPPLVDDLVADCRLRSTATDDRLAGWVVRLADLYPGDPALAVVPLLNHVRLEPGQAIHLSPGHVHSYLRGVGVEVMSSSDNVLRAGFTSKLIDRDELLRVLRAEPLPDPYVAPGEDAPGRYHYRAPGAPFALTRIELDGRLDLCAHGPELLICTAGDAGRLASGQARYVEPGESYVLDGRATVFRVEATAASAMPAADVTPHP